ncbi:molybdopterin-dependent oxidoreductase [Escherichia coli]|nr:molybdopterin-dependent oxidoreductase [Escherichia coli]
MAGISLTIPRSLTPRLKNPPMIRRQRGGKLEPVSRDEALNYVAERLSAIKEKYGPDAIQTTGSSRGTGNETNYVMQKICARRYWYQ